MCSSAGDTATNQGNRDMANFEIGNIIFVEQDTSASVVDGCEEASIVNVLGSDHHPRGATHTLCWIEWADRPVIYQRNGAVLPRTQVWVPNSLNQYKAA
jgi:hypothetical protein